MKKNLASKHDTPSRSCQSDLSSPDLTPSFRVHRGAHRAVPVLGKLGQVGHGAVDPELQGGVGVGQHLGGSGQGNHVNSLSAGILLVG